MNSIVIGKRIPIGAAIEGIGIAIASLYPDKAVAIMALATVATVIVQVIWVNKFGVTT